MEATSRGVAAGAPAARRFREEGEEPEAPEAREAEEIVLRTNLPLEVHMTDEPGGDPYNHSGRFRRMFR
jgi:hypothetical protein